MSNHGCTVHNRLGDWGIFAIENLFTTACTSSILIFVCHRLWVGIVLRASIRNSDKDETCNPEETKSALAAMGYYTEAPSNTVAVKAQRHKTRASCASLFVTSGRVPPSRTKRQIYSSPVLGLLNNFTGTTITLSSVIRSEAVLPDHKEENGQSFKDFYS